jgi:hypothetical protein
MKVIERTPNQLILTIPPRFAILTCLIGLCFIIQPSLVFFSFAYFLGSTNLTCQRAENKQVNCQISNTHLFDFVKSEPIYLNNVQSTTFEDDGDSKTVFVNTPNTRHPVYLYSDTEAKAINKFINSQEQHLVIYESNWKFNLAKDNFLIILFSVIIAIIVVLITLSFISFGVTMVFSPVLKTYIFDIPSASITIKECSWLGSKKTVKAFSDILDIVIEGNDIGEYTVYLPFLLLQPDIRLVLWDYNSGIVLFSGYGTSREKALERANLVRAFLVMQPIA